MPAHEIERVSSVARKEQPQRDTKNTTEKRKERGLPSFYVLYVFFVVLTTNRKLVESMPEELTGLEHGCMESTCYDMARPDRLSSAMAQTYGRPWCRQSAIIGSDERCRPAEPPRAHV